ncbi:rhamnogalacturonan lyase family protein [Flavobacterium sp. WC2509]|uniref:rhamnogalacturonan lyase family protein n=1 Tax=Flavobacterium sp. WC2509 TaxID=3461406 RepID=UPI004044143A
MKQTYIRLFLILCMIFTLPNVNAQRIVQDLDRGVVAIRPASTKAFISWRLFATEPSTVGFNLYRSAAGGAPVKLNTTDLTQGTNFTDLTANFTVSNEYFVKAVINGIEQSASRSFMMPANTPVQSYMKIPINQTPAGYVVNYVRVGDLDGDGDYDFVMVKFPSTTGLPIIAEAYLQDGTFLWQLDCGPNSLNTYNNEPGSSTLDCGHGDNIEVYDINEDGKAEVLIRTANGVKFGDGAVLNYPSDNNVQFISVLNGMTGAEMSRTQYNNPYLVEGPMNGHFGIAYLDGIHPSLIWEAKNRTGDTDFNDMTTAWDWKNGTLVQKWQFISAQQQKSLPTGHQIRIIDLDGDGKDEICPQGFVIDDDGTLKYTLADKDIYHGDRFFIGDLDAKRPGLEMYGIQQGYSKSGIMWYYGDAKTGEILLTQKDPANRDMARGNVGDFDPRFSGYEFHTFVDYLYNVSGAATSTSNFSSYPNFRIFWDGDLLTENLDYGRMIKWNYLTNNESRIQIDGYNSFWGVNPNVGPNTPSFVGDILGDWREEVIYASSDQTELRIYTTPITTNERIYTLSQNPAYLNSMHVRGYYQGHLTDFYIGDGMQEPPLSPIQKADKYWEGTTSVWDSSSPNWTSTTGNKIFSNGDSVMFDVRGNNTNPIQLTTDYSPSKIIAMNPQGKDYVFSGTGKLTGTMEFVKALAGAVTFNGNYDYTGATSITEGTLNVNGSLVSNVTIEPKGVIGGIGTFKGAVTLKKGYNIDGGKIAPGNGNADNLIGSLIIEGNLVVPGDNNFAFDIVPTATKINDSLVVKGNLTFSGKNTLIIKFKDGLAKSGTYSLIKCNGTLTANAADFTIFGLDGVPSEVLVENNQIKLKVLGLRGPGLVTWKGTVDNVWDVYKTNFDLNGATTGFTPKDTVKFDETGLIKSVQLSDFADTSGIIFDATSDYTINGTGSIDGTGDLIKNNTNTVTVNLTKSTYTGKTIVNGGTLAVSTIDFGGSPSSIGATANTVGNFVVNNSTLKINHNSTTDRVLTITGNTTINTPNTSEYAIFQGDITGSGNLIKEGTGVLYLLYKNSYSGETILKDGTLYLRGALGNGNGLGTLGKLTIESGSFIMENRQANDNPNWNIVVPSGKSGSFTPDGRCTLNGTLTGAGTLMLNIPFIRTAFRGDWSAFSGAINVNGDFRLDNTFGYSKATINLIASSSSYATTAYSVTSSRTIKFGELNGVAATSLSAANWEIGAKNTNSVFNGTIASNLLTKVGTGSLTLTGNNTYAGVTTVSAGQLIVNNTTGTGAGTGALTVANGAALKGTGILANVITVSSGGTLAPGYPSFGTLTNSKNVTLNAGSFYECDVNSTTDTADLLSTGANVLTLNGTLKITNQSGVAYVIGDTFKIFNGTNITGNFTAINPAQPGIGLVWDLSLLKTTGVISVIRDPNLSTIVFNSNTVTPEASVYPNPTSGNFTVELNSLNEGDGTISIVNIKGETVQQRNVTFVKGNQTLSFDISRFSSGVYFVKINGVDGTVTKKIVLVN